MRTNNTKNISLKKGLHVAIVTSTRPGYGGSLLAFETYISCKISGIPAILATYDVTKAYPSIGSDLRRLATNGGQAEGGSTSQTPESLILLIAEAKENNAMLIIDIKSGNEGEAALNEVAEVISLTGADTIIGLVPALHGMDTEFRKLDMLNISFTSVMLRYWGFRSPDIAPEAPMGQVCHHWRPGFLSTEMLDLILNFPLPLLKNVSDPEIYISESETPIKNVKSYIEKAHSAFYEAILDDLADRDRVM
ncbi:hypothetical protein [Luteolibacter sp. AS25]|uniref:hypothetical protein n=1 Tax=Luteolibacter sp. AS25 TaxID=3135776 RepID=UPI00398B657F